MSVEVLLVEVLVSELLWTVTGRVIPVLVVCGCSLSSWWCVDVILVVCPRVIAVAAPAASQSHEAIRIINTRFLVSSEH